MADGSIFRDVALERLSTPERLDQGLRVTDRLGWLLLLAMALLVATAGAGTVLFSIPIRVQADGIILSPAGVLDVTSSSQGRVLDLMVAPGDHVAADAAVARVDQPDLRQEREQAQADLRNAEDERARIVEFQGRNSTIQAAVDDQKRTAAAQATAFLQQRLAWLNERAGYEAELAEKRMITRQRTIDTRIEIGQVQEDLARARNSLKDLELAETQQRVERERELLQLDLRIDAARRHIAAIDERLDRLEVVRSPYEGVVVELKVNRGELLERGGSLMTLLPPDRGRPGAGLIAVLYVPPTEGKKLKPGMAVQIAPSTVKREEFGFMLGRVRQVAEIPSTAEGMMRTLKNRQLVQTLSGGGAPFEVQVDLEPDPGNPSGYRWSSSRGPSASISSGTLCAAEIVTRTLHVASVVVPAFERLFDPQP